MGKPACKHSQKRRSQKKARQPSQGMGEVEKGETLQKFGDTYSWIAYQLEVWAPITTFAVEIRFQIRDQFWIPQPKLHG